MTRRALVMAGGTGGHIFPGLAVAEALRARDWTVHWIGAPDSMESRLVPPRGFAFETVQFSGVRGKGPMTLALLPLRLLKAFWQSLQVVRRVKPDVVIGLGGYISFPAGMMSVLLGKPLVLHEQNSRAGMANKVLAGVADRVFTAFPQVLARGEWVVTLDADTLALLADWRRQQTAELEESGGKISVNDLIIKACAIALRRVPECNASFVGAVDDVVGYGTIGAAAQKVAHMRVYIGGYIGVVVQVALAVIVVKHGESPRVSWRLVGLSQADIAA